MSNRSFADAIVDQMVTCLDVSDVGQPPDDMLCLSEFDLWMWKADKSLTDNMICTLMKTGVLAQGVSKQASGPLPLIWVRVQKITIQRWLLQFLPRKVTLKYP
jgi:hypothetical protein